MEVLFSVPPRQEAAHVVRGGAFLAMAAIGRDVTAVLTTCAPVLASFSLRDVVEEPLSSGPASVPEFCWDFGRAHEAQHPA
ncbi:MAG: hypothetical protein ACREDT_04610 [Methylocella sp.]